jgi:hypothetical protein
MRPINIILTITASLKAAEAYSAPNAGHFNRVARGVEPPKWNFAQGTTEGAKADGSEGVIIEPDLIEGRPAKDGATVKKIKFGPYTIKSGQKKEYPIGAFGLTPVEPGRPPPCTECYITAMQLNLEYPNGTHANVDTGAWWAFLILHGRVGN